MIASNPLQGAISVEFKEEDVYTLNSTTTAEAVGGFSRTLGDPSIMFPMLDPSTDNPLGIDASVAQLYAMCYSLYIFLAKQRDAGAPSGSPVVQVWPVPEVIPEPVIVPDPVTEPDPVEPPPV